ncbi:MAG: hypothetical protein K0Q49_1277 [Haloplasmataceae bacterium]|jgi:uncharacterized membrane-anchored protein YitT (DUF2179 family)|nr:hypothetical protein [Haloplasmataceae bacterium]
MRDFLAFIKYKDKRKFQNIIITMLGAALYSVGLNWFIFPAGQYPGGFPGVAQLISNYLNTFDIHIGTNILWFGLNIPVFYLGFKSVGKRFTVLSMVSVAFGALALGFLPSLENMIGADKAIIFHQDSMLSAILGGVIAGVGVGITLKVGSSTGGMDIVSQYLSIKKNGSVGTYSFIINGAIILLVGFTANWYYAAYTIINLFISSVVIDKIHTRHNKLTLMIVTDKRDELVTALHKRVYRGITILPAEGAYTRKEKTLLMMVIASFELYNVISTINEIDPVAFTNVTKSQNVFGNFVKTKVD